MIAKILQRFRRPPAATPTRPHYAWPLPVIEFRQGAEPLVEARNGGMKPLRQLLGELHAQALPVDHYTAATLQAAIVFVTGTLAANAPGHTDLTVAPESLAAWLDENPLPAEIPGLVELQELLGQLAAEASDDAGAWNQEGGGPLSSALQQRLQTAHQALDTLDRLVALARRGEAAPARLDLAELRRANIARQAEWPGADQVTLAFRGVELAGETGEACNLVKKLERERLGIRGSRATVADLGLELADVVISADLVAADAGVDLAAAVAEKFNATSEAQGLATRLPIEARP